MGQVECLFQYPLWVTLLEGRVYEGMHMQYAEEETGLLVRLSPRESQVLRHVCLGDTDPEIARSLKIHPGTVRQYLHDLYRGLRFSSRHELVLWGLQRPAALSGQQWVSLNLHPPDCPCAAPYCVTMRSEITVS